MKRFEIDIARRIALGADGGKSSPAVKVAVASVALSIAVMLLSVAIVFGFKREITRKIQGFNPHISIYSAAADDRGRPVIDVSEDLEELLDDEPYVIDWQPAVNTLALLKTKDNFKGLYLNGLAPGFDTGFLRDNLVEGKLPDFSDPGRSSRQMMLSRRVAGEMGLSAGDSINLYTLGAQTSVKRMQLTGIFDSHLDMFDNLIAFCSIDAARALSGIGEGEATRIDITTGGLTEVDDDAATLRSVLSEAAGNDGISPFLAVNTIHTQCGGLFGWLSLLDTNVWVILVLLTLVSSFTLISGMLIIILEKVRFIGVMKALGASSASVRHIFIWLAMRIGVLGMTIGTLLALAIIALQYFFHIVPLDPEAYYMDYAPVEFCWWAFAAVEIGFALVIYLVLAIPSRLVSHISPAESMRFE